MFVEKHLGNVAEDKGFEPSLPFRVDQFSKLAQQSRICLSSSCRPTGIRTPTKCLEGTCAIHYTIGRNKEFVLPVARYGVVRPPKPVVQFNLTLL